jgi:hypothetical protein
MNNNDTNGHTIHNDDIQEVSYEDALYELESEQLYGATPKLFDLDSIANMFRKGRINLAPKYQRGYVWKVGRASRLVVTVLCNRIVPGIVLHEKERGVYDVVDGKQRLTTLLSFYLAGEDPELYNRIYEQQSSRATMFHVLGKLDENYESLEGLTYNELSTARQRALQAYTVPCTIIPYGTPKEEVFSCYEDINSGGEDLKAQQLRRAVYWGEYVELLDRLAANEDFQCIRDPVSFHAGKYQVDPKESDRELILRAFAWARDFQGYKRPLKTFLNKELQHFETLSQGSPTRCNEALRRQEEEFKFIMKVWRNVFSESDGAFRVWSMQRNGKWGWSSTISSGLWDVMYLVLSELRHTYPTEPIYMQQKEEIQETIKELFQKEKLEVSSAVTVAKFMERRDIIRRALSAVLRNGGATSSSRRQFPDSNNLKESLFESQNGLCAICGNEIDRRRLGDGTYVNLDHVKPFSLGGLSTKDNAALAHAACNQSKGSKVF